MAIVRYSLYFKSYDNPDKKIIFDISYPEGYEERYKSTYDSKYFYQQRDFSWVSEMLKKFQVPYDKISFFDQLSSYLTLDLRYNDTFSDTNACLNPQKVYNKDMSNGNYSDVTILNYDMTGVNIENAVFTNDFINAYQEGILKRNLK